MSTIGEFTRTPSGFTGHLRTLTVDAELTLIALDGPASDTAPAFRIHLGDADGPDVGAGWNRTGERAGQYIALVLDDPTLPAAIRANLFHAGGDGPVWFLVWSRAEKRHGEA